MMCDNTAVCVVLGIGVSLAVYLSIHLGCVWLFRRRARVVAVACIEVIHYHMHAKWDPKTSRDSFHDQFFIIQTQNLKLNRNKSCRMYRYLQQVRNNRYGKV